MPPPATAAAAARVQRRDPRDDPDADVKPPEAPVLTEGVLRKQGARVHMWSSRYAVLRGPKLLMYRATREEVLAFQQEQQQQQQRQQQQRNPKPTGASGSGGGGGGGDAAAPQPPLQPLHKREFVLMPGCYVSDVRELPGAGGKGRSLWEFRLHWCVPWRVAPGVVLKSEPDGAPRGSGICMHAYMHTCMHTRPFIHHPPTTKQTHAHTGPGTYTTTGRATGRAA